jgi:lipoprotein signal peptidase
VSDSRHLTQLARIALLVAVVDLVTKAAAKRFLVQDPGSFTSTLQLAVVHNDAGAFGWSAGVYTWQLNLALTLAAIVFMIPVTRDLAKVDDSAPRALGLIVGGALGNLTSLITSPAGVVDFIALSFDSWGIVLNVADVAAYAGLAMILRTGALVALAIRRNRRMHLVRGKRDTRESRAKRGKREIRAVFAERAALEHSLKQRDGGWIRRPELEVMVADRSDVGAQDTLMADAPPLVSGSVARAIDIGHPRPRRPIIGDASRARAIEARVTPLPTPRPTSPPA